MYRRLAFKFSLLGAFAGAAFGQVAVVSSSTLAIAGQFNQTLPVIYGSSTVSSRIAAASSSAGACDLNGDGAVNIIDVQLVTDMYLGVMPCTANIAGIGVCTTQVVQLVQNAALGGQCAILGHSVSLSWNASSSASVNYNIYRSILSGGPYEKVNSTPVASTSYVDGSVVAGLTYYYVTTAVDSGSNESDYSNEATATIPLL